LKHLQVLDIRLIWSHFTTNKYLPTSDISRQLPVHSSVLEAIHTTHTDSIIYLVNSLENRVFLNHIILFVPVIILSSFTFSTHLGRAVQRIFFRNNTITWLQVAQKNLQHFFWPFAYIQLQEGWRFRTISELLFIGKNNEGENWDTKTTWKRKAFLFSLLLLAITIYKVICTLSDMQLKSHATSQIFSANHTNNTLKTTEITQHKASYIF